MPYTSEDLSVFDCLRNPSNLDGTSYFEFHAGHRPAGQVCWLEGSLFIRDAGFDFVAELFYQTVPGFDYFSFVDVEPQAGEAVFAYYSSLFSTDIWADVPASEIAPRLRLMCEQIRDYFRHALQEQQPLCILGM